MKYITLGKTGLRVSKLGFGGIPVQRTEKNKVNELFDAVEAAGINYIDTARGYTVSEEYIGEAIEGRRDKFILATKSMSRSYADMKRDIGISLKNLRTDYIDLYQIHNPSMEQLDTVLGSGGALEALNEAKSEGKIGHIGITAHSAEVFERALSLDFIETIMFPYNIVENQGEKLIERCKKQNVGFIVMKALAGGAIDDAHLAIKYAFSNSFVDVVIPGMYSPDEVAVNVAAAEDTTPFSSAELDKIEQIRSRLSGNFCRRCNYCAPCTVGINIPGIFLFEGYLERYDLEGWARDRYDSLKVKASACIGCGKCETRCPYHLPIRQMLQKAALGFGE